MQSGFVKKKNDVQTKISICNQQMNMILWNTETFMKKLNGFCRDHVVTLKNHSLGEEQLRPQISDENKLELGLKDKGLKSSLLEPARGSDLFSPARDFRKSNSILVPSGSPSKRRNQLGESPMKQDHKFLKLQSVKEAVDESLLISVKNEPQTVMNKPTRRLVAKNQYESTSSLAGQMSGRHAMNLVDGKQF